MEKTTMGFFDTVDFSKAKKAEIIQALKSLASNPSNPFEGSEELKNMIPVLQKKTKQELVDLYKKFGNLAVESAKKQALKKETALKKSGSSKKTGTKSTGSQKPQPEQKPAETPKKQVPVPTKKVSKHSMDCARIFPEVLEYEDIGRLVRANDRFHKYQELMEYMVAGNSVYFATYWTPRHIREFQYGKTREVKSPEKFPDNLDILLGLVACETVDTIWAMSRYTEAMFSFQGVDLKPLEDEDENGKFFIRVSAGMEFEIYLPAAEEEEK